MKGMADTELNVREIIKENRLIDETYFLILAVILAFGILSTLGTGLGTENPVVTVVSTSMCNALHVGDILLVRSVSFDQISEGDIIVYDVPDRAEITINNEEYRLEDIDGSRYVQFNDYTIALEHVNVRQNNDNEVKLSVNGEQNDVLEGDTLSFNDNELTVDFATGLPQRGIPIVHRVIEKEDNYLETIGDNNPSQLEFEQDIRPHQVYGNVFFRIPRAGLIKIVSLDLAGFDGSTPLVIDNTPRCQA